MSKFAVILPAAGQSRRFSRDGQKKVFRSIDGRPVWRRAADLFLNRKDVVQVIVVISPDDREYFNDRFGSDLAVLGIDCTIGGAQRYDSVANGLKAVKTDADFVAIHDAARPCVTDSEISQVFSAAQKHGAAILATPIAATIKRGQKTVQQTIDRNELWAAQTPQVFRKDWLVNAYQQLNPSQQSITDDSQVIEDAGHTVHIVQGQSTNLKITTGEDLKLATAILKSQPKGIDSLFHPFKDS